MLKIMVANLSHVDVISNLEQELFKNEAYTLLTLKDELLSKQRLYLVAQNEKQEVVGYVGAALLEDVADIMKIGVQNNYQRLGVASALLKELVVMLKQKKFIKVMLEVSEKNDKAIAFYEKFGFVKVSVRKNYYNNKESAFIYVLTLK